MAGDWTPQRLQSACSHERAQRPPDSILPVSVCVRMGDICLHHNFLTLALLHRVPQHPKSISTHGDTSRKHGKKEP